MASVPTPAVAPAVPDVASLGDRALGALIDLLALGAAFWVIGNWLAPRFGGSTPTGFSLTGLPALLIIGLSLVAWLVYYICLEWWFGATPGKWVVGAKVLGIDGRRPALSPALLRNLMRLIDGIGVYLVGGIVVLLTKRNQRLGDLVAGTVVVRRPYHPVARVAALLFALALPVVALVVSMWFRPASETATGTTTTESASTGSTQAADRQTAAGSGGQRQSGIALAGGSVPADGPLAMGGFRLTVGKDGADRIDARFKPGESVALNFKLVGLAADSDASSAGRVRMTINAVDPFGVSVVEPVVRESRPALSPDGIDSYAQLGLPDYCVPGEHRVDVTIEDLVSSRRVRVVVPFMVDAPPYEPSDVLVLRQVRLTEGKDGPTRTTPVYATGATVYMAFQLVGFKPGPDGQVKARLDVAIATASGESLANLSLLTVDQRFFYVPRRIPVTAHITLGDSPAGEYVATLKATDELGGQTSEHPLRFTITK